MVQELNLKVFNNVRYKKFLGSVIANAHHNFLMQLGEIIKCSSPISIFYWLPNKHIKYVFENTSVIRFEIKV